MTESQTWTGAERRSGRERRATFQHHDSGRRHVERRQTEGLLQAIPSDEGVAFEPREADDAPRSQEPIPLRPQSEGTASMDADRPTRTPIAVPSVAQIFGHPLHPAVVPMPIGALTLAFASDVAYVLTDDPFFARASRALTVAGLVTGGAAAALGAMDFLGRERTRSYTAAWAHAGGNVAAMALSATSLALRQRDERGAVVPAGLVLSTITAGLLGVTGWLGGELTYRHRIGVLPEDEA
jgi:uncharacterized membrane protein